MPGLTIWAGASSKNMRASRSSASSDYLLMRRTTAPARSASALARSRPPPTDIQQDAALGKLMKLADSIIADGKAARRDRS